MRFELSIESFQLRDQRIEPVYEIESAKRDVHQNGDPMKFTPTLTCPICGHENTHSEGVRVRNRRQEDGPGIEVRVTAGSASVQEARTFAGRRDDTEIAFSCEGCEGFFVLGFVQQKGLTLVNVAPGRPDWLP